MTAKPLQAGRLLDPQLQEDLARLLADVQVDDGGGSSLLKALLAADLVVGDGLSEIFELGVWRGRFLLPMAMVLTALGRGTATGVDPYTAAAAAQYDNHGRGIDLKRWPESIDWESVYNEVLSTAARFGIVDRTRLIRRTSAEAAGDVPASTIDLLHIDGNHDQAVVSQDLESFLPKVRVGGYVILDDCSWPALESSFRLLNRNQELVFRLFDNGELCLDSDGLNDFAVFRIRPSAR